MMFTCHYHHNTNLQNFCSNKQCSIPLCPKCIPIHLSEPGNHCLVTLQEMVSLTANNVKQCTKELEKQHQFFKTELNPEVVCQDYYELIQKYRIQNIQQINQTYNSLKEQIQIVIKNVFHQHLYSIKAYIQQKLELFKNYLNKLSSSETILPTIIKINDSSQIQNCEDLFRICKTQKLVFKSCLPSFIDGYNGKLQIKTNSIQNLQIRQYQNPIYEKRAFTEEPMFRIAHLQDKLFSLRSRVII